MSTNCLVKIEEGLIKGKKLQATTFSNKKYYAFQGVPYAQPPIQNLRFKDPQPVLPWEGVHNATKEAPACPQKHVLLKEAVGDEDNCLALNVYTPSLSKKQLRPVLVWIHGGGFTFGTGNADLHDPDYWIELEVVVVTCNYRVGALGFLSLGTAEVPGNAGLKDQVMVLRWVQRNITEFGGDPTNVTLFGESAGAASVHYHVLSPMSRGLFHQAIMMSGCALNSWALSRNPVERSMLLGEKLGYATSDPDHLLHFLQSLPALDIVKTQSKVVNNQDKQDVRVFPFVPCVEPPQREGEGERFLTEHPRSLLQRGQVAPVPLIIGANDKEGMLILNDLPHNDKYFKVLNSNFARIVPGDLALPLNAPERIKHYFFGEKEIGWTTMNEYLDYYGDVFFYIGLDEAIRLHLAAAVAPLYSYCFSYDGRLGLLSWYLRQLYTQCNLKGVCHADDVGYIFKSNLPGPPKLEPGSPDEDVVRTFTGLWAHFALSGNLNPLNSDVVWNTAKRDGVSWSGHLDINHQLTMRPGRIMGSRMDFWNSLTRPHARL